MKRAYILTRSDGSTVTNEAGDIKCRAEDDSMEFFIPSNSAMHVDIEQNSYKASMSDYAPEDEELDPLHENTNHQKMSLRERDAPPETSSFHCSPSSGTADGVHNAEDKPLLWTPDATKIFLASYKNFQDLLDSGKIKRKAVMWSRVASDMKSRGYQVTPIQAENKYKTLKRAYNNAMSKAHKTRRPPNRRSMNGLERELDELFGESTSPVARPEQSTPPGRSVDADENMFNSLRPTSPASSLSASSKSSFRSQDSDEKFTTMLEGISDAIAELHKKISEQLRYQKKLYAAQAKFHKSVLKAQRRKLEEIRRKNNLLEEFVKKRR